MKQGQRNPIRRGQRALGEWPSELTRSECAWSARPYCPLPGRPPGTDGFLRDRLHLSTGASPLSETLSDQAVDATLRLMLRRGYC